MTVQRKVIPLWGATFAGEEAKPGRNLRPAFCLLRLLRRLNSHLLRDCGDDGALLID
jgi:hypothetical protein